VPLYDEPAERDPRTAHVRQGFVSPLPGLPAAPIRDDPPVGCVRRDRASRRRISASRGQGPHDQLSLDLEAELLVQPGGCSVAIDHLEPHGTAAPLARGLDSRHQRARAQSAPTVRRHRSHAAHPPLLTPARDQSERQCMALLDHHPRALEVDPVGPHVLAHRALVHLHRDGVVREACAEQRRQRG
jgi:hypothetical protein